MSGSFPWLRAGTIGAPHMGDGDPEEGRTIRPPASRMNADNLKWVNSVQIDPAGATAGKSFSGSNTLLKKFVREYIATSATISITFASV